MLSDVTIIVPTFLRPGYLTDCLQAIAKNLPECKVIVVADDGLPPTGKYDVWISLPFDSGLPAKRNAGAKLTSTKYLLMGTDDFDFSTKEVRDGILKMLNVLDTYPTVDVAAGRHGNLPYEGFLTYVPGSHIQ